MSKGKHFIKDGKIIKEIKSGRNVTHEEITEEEFNKYQSGQSKNGLIWLSVLLVLVVAFIYTVTSQF